MEALSTVTMDQTRILPGELLVSKGALKQNSTLPEVGLKEVSPNGSWLEQKQIQAALEARKQLIEVERIEKSGVLSHAEWREDLMLAEVTQIVGGYWQYLGHNVGKRLFLNPEEALFLMEINCLLLKYNEVKVSLQQGYALMLRTKITLMHYKVYASLSRLGYRVFRHRVLPVSMPKEYEKKIDKPSCSEKNTNDLNCENNDNALEKDSTSICVDVTADQCKTDLVDRIMSETDKTTSKTTKDEFDLSNDETLNTVEKSEEIEINIPDRNKQTSTSENLKKVEMKKLKSSKYIQYKINKLKTRKYKIKESNDARHSYFDNIPEFSNNPIVSVTAPDQRYLPGKVYLRTSSYFLNVEKMRTKSTAPDEYSTSSSSNGSMNSVYPNNVNHLRHPPPHSYRGNNWTEYFNFRFSSQPNPLRHFNYWRPQTSLNYFQFNMTFQRPFLYPQYGPRIMLNPFLQPFMAPSFSGDVSLNSNNCAQRKKRVRDTLKHEHFASIERLATYVKNSILELRLSDNNVSKLNHLIQTYNTRYKTRLRLSADFTVITDENIIDTIEVEDDEEDTTAKKAKLTERPQDAFNDNLERLQQLANKLKRLEIKNEATSRHRRMFSQLLKRFNHSYNIDYYVNDNFDVINRNDLTVLSSSDNEEVAETTSNKTPRKKLKNPFSILKQLSEKHVEEENCASTSSISESPFRYSELTVKTFKRDWLPEESDFGRAEIVSKDIPSDVIDSRREEFLFDFLKIQPDKFKNWFDIKISFLKCLQETCVSFDYVDQKHIGLGSLVKPEEFNDAALVLKKLSIFENHKTINEDTIVEIDFDVYNRDVQNFKKSNRPLPHFRVVCIRESATLPSGADIATLHSKYKDNVAIIFAVVGVSSVSYLQVNPVDVPIYTSSNINTV